MVDGRWNKQAVGKVLRQMQLLHLNSITSPLLGCRAGARDRIEAPSRNRRPLPLPDESAAGRPEGAGAELKRRKLSIPGGEYPLEKAFTPDLCRELAESGCIAVSGGLEAASDRLLALMNKGVTVAQAARAAKAFADAGILVHAYLMYGFPSQTVPETVDALETVRQLIEEGCLHSGYFHRFACTVHSPVGGIRKNSECNCCRCAGAVRAERRGDRRSGERGSGDVGRGLRKASTTSCTAWG